MKNFKKTERVATRWTLVRWVGGCACRLMPLGGVARQSTKVERRVDPPKTLQTTVFPRCFAYHLHNLKFQYLSFSVLNSFSFSCVTCQLYGVYYSQALRSWKWPSSSTAST